MANRREEEVFADLQKLCTSPGYVHAIAYICFRDHTIGFSHELTVEDVQRLYSPSTLIRSEVSILIGLLVQTTIEYTIPKPNIMQEYLERTDTLLKELHDVLIEPLFLSEVNGDPAPYPTDYGPMARETIFYSGESALVFQYLDLAVKKYNADDEWLKNNKNFTISEARSVIDAIFNVLGRNLQAEIEKIRKLSPTDPTILPGFMFCIHDLEKELPDHDSSTISAVLDAFSLAQEDRNQTYRSLNDFNRINAAPLIRVDDNQFISFLAASLAEAIYESPYYWMANDTAYKNKSFINRGIFTETFCRERLEIIFGSKNVYPNARILNAKNELGEVDVLVLYGNRALILQAKSKQLTHEAKKGNINAIKNDFQKSVHNSYKQAVICANSLVGKSSTFIDGNF